MLWERLDSVNRECLSEFTRSMSKKVSVVHNQGRSLDNDVAMFDVFEPSPGM